MLNWRLEEQQYVDEQMEKWREQYWKGIGCLFISEKKYQKLKQEEEEEVRKSFRIAKLDNYFYEIVKERQRIDNIIENLNKQFDEYLIDIGGFVKNNIKSIEVKVVDYNMPCELTPMEFVDIQLKPLKVSFLQEKIGKRSDKE